MDASKLTKKLKELNLPLFRTKQALRGYYTELLSDWSELKVWPSELRSQFDLLDWSPLSLISVLETKSPASAKLLFGTADGYRIETVIMRHKDGRNTVCVSSQAGCAMGCTFCATGANGFNRNLTAEEIVDQVVQAARWLRTNDLRRTTHGSERIGDDIRVTNVVFMGMGEPFNNPDQVFLALHRLMDAEGFGLGARHISISTCGIIPGIQRLAKEAPQVNLAISLHAADQELRAKIMPVAAAYPLDKLMHAIRDYLQRTNRKVMFEHVMLKGVNDGPKDAERLADLLGDFRHLAHVNLIKYHQTGRYQASNESVRRSFANLLKRRGIAVTERVSFGEEIEAACGQLAGKHKTTDD